MQTDRYSRPDSRATQYDAGLRNHMLSVYNRMTAGVLITALTAWVVGSSEVLRQLFLGGPQAYIVMFAPLAIVFFAFNPAKMSSQKLMLAFGGISVLYGISFSTIALAFAQADIARALFITSAMFAAVSIFGYTTKKDLRPLATFAVMAIWGLILVGITGIFVEYSHGVEIAISAFSVLVFAGLTAWQTQDMKNMYNAAHGEEINSRLAWSAALNLYISFVAMFMHILQLTSNR
ncbi:MAG: Bax inhibitor-1 family protein [Alphaproteobacteria bacterium]